MCMNVARFRPSSRNPHNSVCDVQFTQSCAQSNSVNKGLGKMSAVDTRLLSLIQMSSSHLKGAAFRGCLFFGGRVQRSVRVPVENVLAG